MGSLILAWYDKVWDVINGFLVFIPKILYFILTCVLSVIDLCQVLFRKLAGVDPIIISDKIYTGDSVYKIITDALFTGAYPAIRTLFWGLIILGVLMLIITSIIMVIRVEYADDKGDNSKGKIVKNFFKALFSFAIVPIACIFGMYLANALVGTIDKATATQIEISEDVKKYFDSWESDSEIDGDSSYMAYNVFGLNIPTNSEPFSGIIFKCCAYGSNRARTSNKYYTQVIKNSEAPNVGGKTSSFGIFNQPATQEQAADLIDTAFAINAKVKGNYELNYSVADDFFNDNIKFLGSSEDIKSFSKYNPTLVFYYYNLWTFNYLVGYVAVISIGTLYFKFVLGLMTRLFEIAGLFLVAPIAVSIMPMDDSRALKTWRKTFIAKFVIVTVLVGTVNLITSLNNIAQTIKLTGHSMIDLIVTIFFLIAAFNAIDSLNKTISNILVDGGKDAYDGTMASAGQVKDSFTRGALASIAGAKLASAPLTLAGKGLGYGAGWAGGKMAKGIAEGNERRFANRLNIQEQDQIRRQINEENEANRSALRSTFESRDTSNLDNVRKNFATSTSGLNSDSDLYKEFIGSDFGKSAMSYNKNNKSAMSRAFNSGKFTDEQKTEFMKFMNKKQEEADFDNSSEGKALKAQLAGGRIDQAIYDAQRSRGIREYSALDIEGKVNYHHKEINAETDPRMLTVKAKRNDYKSSYGAELEQRAKEKAERSARRKKTFGKIGATVKGGANKFGANLKGASLDVLDDINIFKGVFGKKK